MCGICGIVHADPERPVDRVVVERMCDAIVHRGPDDAGFHVEGRVGLGMRRLSIIDLEHGSQPMTNEDGTVHLVHNGEIYNYRSLRDALRGAGHQFRTHSDTEVIVHAYEEGRDSFLTRLRGMFALAVWDDRRERLTLAIDRFAIKPLYYSETAVGIVFGSELSCLLRSGLVDREVDLDALAEYFTFGYIPAPRTVFRGVKKLAPGQALVWTPSHEAEISRYWLAPESASRRGGRRNEVRTALRDVLRESVQAHLVSDVPLGAFLSGGVDSSTIVALMSEVVSEPVKTFSIGFADPRYNELPKARLVARRFETDHHELTVVPEDVDLLPRIVAHFGEPFADASALPTYHVSRLAHQHVKVALSGDGGDELFLGYTIFRGIELARLAERLPRRVRAAALATAGALPTGPSAAWNDRLDRLRKRVTDTFAGPHYAYRRKLTAPGVSAVVPFLSEELGRELLARDPYSAVEATFRILASDGRADSLDTFVRAGFAFSLPNDMLVKVDRMSMAHSLEVRVPLLDHVVAEFVATVPVEDRFRGWRLKRLLKEVMRGTLPDEILAGPKRGFVVPLSAWFRSDLASFAREALTAPDAKARGFVDTAAVDDLLARHASGRSNLGSVIWSLLVFELWCREVLAGA